MLYLLFFSFFVPFGFFTCGFGDGTVEVFVVGGGLLVLRGLRWGWGGCYFGTHCIGFVCCVFRAVRRAAGGVLSEGKRVRISKIPKKFLSGSRLARVKASETS